MKTCAFCGWRDAVTEDDGKPSCSKCDEEAIPVTDGRGPWVDGDCPIAHRAVALARRHEGMTVGEIRDALELGMADQDKISHALLRATRAGYLVRHGSRGRYPGDGYTYTRGPREWRPGAKPRKRVA